MADSVAALPANPGASTGRRLALFRAPVTGPNQGTQIDTIVNRVRHLVRSNAWAGAAVDKWVASEIGTGVQAKPVNGSPEHKVRATRTWKRWIKVSDAQAVLDFYGQQALASREVKEAGEAFARFRWRRASDGLPVPLQIQLIESEQCPRHYNAYAPNGNVIQEGIEINKRGQAAAYWMYRAHPGDTGALTIDAGTLVRIPADEIMHIYHPLRAGQLRGIPDMASVIALIFGLDRVQDSVMERQAVANLHAGWFTRPPESANVGPLGEARLTDDADGTPIAGMEPGTMSELPPGWGVTFNDPPGAGTDFPEYMRFNLLGFAARVGIPYEVLTGDLRMITDRALKLLLLEFHRLIEMSLWLYTIPMFCGRVRDEWWNMAVLSGALSVANYYDDPDFYRETLWVPQGWPNSHPVQDIRADVQAIRGGISSRTKVALSKGEDPNEIDAEQAEDNARADKLGLSYDSDGRRAQAESALQIQEIIP